jgi:hypothetical protein
VVDEGRRLQARRPEAAVADTRSDSLDELPAGLRRMGP